ncbi:MAG TPA: PrsW family glutamic-type intramembrane protease [Candidatus Ozemobacteraceae bacterium]|nr:PrsW family glutamic-type intramembrane protease [Candidatus Ozemobacteraceae bacterium]
MIPLPLSSLLLTALPVGVFVWLFRTALADPVLREGALAGGIAGAFAILPLKFVFYPALQAALGIDLRSLLADSEEFWMRFAVAVILVGGLEETMKLGAAIAGAGWMGSLWRSTAIFLASLAAGLGFSAAESIDYISIFGADVLLTRIPLSTTGHVLFSGFAGWAAALALCKRTKTGESAATWRGYVQFLGGLLGAAVLHGSFNMIAMRTVASTSIPLLAAMLVFGAALLREGWVRVLVLDRAERGSDEPCALCGAVPADSRGRFCAACGARRPLVR